MHNIKIEPASWVKVFALIAKLVQYAKGGFTPDEKQELISDLLDVLGILANDIGEDISHAER
jgi:hypothetical protein